LIAADGRGIGLALVSASEQKMRPERTVKGWVYFALMLFLAADGLAIGYFGGVITYGY
jgi:hypothetical protein